MHQLKDVPISNLLSPEEVAEYLGYSLSSIKRMYREGTIPAAKVGRRWFVSVDVLNDLVTTAVTRKDQP